MRRYFFGLAVFAVFLVARATARADTTTNVVTRILFDGVPTTDAGANVYTELNGKRSLGVSLGEHLGDGTRVTAPAHVTLFITRSDHKGEITVEPGSSLLFVETTSSGQVLHQDDGNVLFSVVPHALDFYRVTFRQFLAAVRGTVFSVRTSRTTATFSAQRGLVDVARDSQVTAGSVARTHIRVPSTPVANPITALVAGRSVSSSGSLRLVDVIDASKTSHVSYSLALSSAYLQNITYYKRQLAAALASHDFERIAASYNNLGLSYDGGGQHAKALLAYADATRADSKLSLAYYNRANSYEPAQARRAIVDYSTAIQLRQDFPYAYNNRGIAFSNTGDDTRAIADYSHALLLYPRLVAAYNNRCLSYEDLGDHSRARADCDRALQLDPQHASAYLNRGNVYKSLGKLDRAFADYDTAARIEPRLAAAYVNRGTIYNIRKAYQRAISDFSAAIQDNPTDSLAFAKRGSAYAVVRDYDRAMSDFNEAIRLDPAWSVPLGGRGVIEFQKHDFDRATADFKAAIALEHNASWLPLWQSALRDSDGMSAFLKGDYNRAIDDFTQEIQDRHSILGAQASLFLRGVAFDRQGDHDNAIADLSEAIRLNPNLVEAYVARGGAFLATGDDASALMDFNKAILLDPASSDAYDGRGNAHFNNGDFLQAVDDFSRAIAITPKSAATFDSRATTYLHLGDYKSASDDYNKAIQIEPGHAYFYLNRGIAEYYNGALLQAQADFLEATHLTPSDPYFAIWLEIANRRQQLPSELSYAVPRLDMTAWPAPIVQLYLGTSTVSAVLAAPPHADSSKQSGEACEATFYAGEFQSLHSAVRAAVGLYRRAASSCPHRYTEWTAAVAALRELKVDLP